MMTEEDDLALIRAGSGSADPLAEWAPTAGPLVSELLRSQGALDAADRGQLLASGIRTLGRCGNPKLHGARAEAHLVVGQVQSGKTLAFTSVAALARDNDYRLIIVVAGTKTNLFGQTVGRLKRDLLQDRRGLTPWRILDTSKGIDSGQLLGLLSGPWEPEKGSQAVICVVLKHQARLASLTRALTEVATQCDLAGVPALIIDDEADQASMNLEANSGGASGVYEALGALRSAVPRHDLLLYTATPEAPLLIGPRDALAPKTVTLLESGREYTGGVELFFEQHDDYVREISAAELAGAALDPDAHEPPQSLRDAVFFFVLSVAAAQSLDPDRFPWPLSMLVHPASTQALHSTYDRWIKRILEDLRDRLDDPEDAAYGELLRGELAIAFDDLRSTVPEVPPIDELARRLPGLIRQTEQRIVNQSTRDALEHGDWGQAPAWILIGGNKLDRGFTVMNLTATYMPRSVGVGNADTLQQRGRFYGYKQRYLGLCRGWFAADTAFGFASYVEHEKVLHRELERLDRDGVGLSEWRRQFLLDPALRPTRRQVIARNTKRFSLRGWFWQSHLAAPGVQIANRQIADDLLNRYRDHAGDEALDPRRLHRSLTLPLSDIRGALLEWSASSDDADKLLGLLLALEEWGSTGQRDARLVFMDGVRSLDSPRRSRQPRPEANEASFYLPQGPSPANGSQYPGDAAIVDRLGVTVQLHSLSLRDRAGATIEPRAVGLGVHVPGSLADLMIESQV